MDLLHKSLNGCKNYLSWERKMIKYNSQEKGLLFELFTLYLFKVHPYYEKLLQEIYMYDDIPHSLIQQFKLPTKDKGIDLICQMDNEWYAIQCKFRSNKKTIPFNELATFTGLSFDRFKKCIIITNCDDIPNELKTQNMMGICGDFWDTITDDIFEKIKLKSKGKKLPKINVIDPYPYQLSAVENSVKHFKDNNNNGILAMSCGTGKTLTSNLIANELKCTKIIIVVPSLHLLSQFYLEWYKLTDFKSILIGSDADKDITSKEGMLLTTSVDQITNWIGKNYNTINVIFTTYQSSDKLITALNNTKKVYDMCIFDEAHKTVGHKDSQFGSLLNCKYTTKKLFMTATPRVYKGNNDDIMSMDDNDIYGKIFYEINMKKAIDLKKLTDYQIIIPMSSDARTHQFIEQNAYAVIKDFAEVPIQMITSAILTIKAIQEYNGKHILTYHGTISCAKVFSELLTYLGEKMKIKMFCEHLSGNTNMNNRAKILKEYEKSSIGIICSAKVLNEGINIKCVDSIVFVDAKHSVIDIIQCMGRCLRLYEGKLLSNVIIPSTNNTIEDNEFNKLWTIIRAIGEQDDSIVEYFKEKKNGRIQKCSLNSNGQLSNVMEVNDVISININTIYEKLELDCYKRLDNWNIWKDLLFEYCDIYKQPPEQKCMYKSRNIGIWLCSQKKKINMVTDKLYMTLSENKYVKESIDIYLKYIETNTYKRLSWNEMKNMLFAFCDEHKKIPTHKCKYENYNVGTWLQDQKKKIACDTDEIYKKLALNEYVKESLELYLNPDSKMVTWNKWKNLVFEYCDANDSIPSQLCKYKNFNIGKWLCTQKEKITSDADELYITLAKNKHVKQSIDTYLSNKKVNKNVTKFTQDEWKKLLFEYCDANKSVPTSKYEYKGKKIGSWLSDQKRKLGCNTDKVYTDLAKNIYVKKSFDKYLNGKEKENDNNVTKFTHDEWKKLLFEYCDINKTVPPYGNSYKGRKIGNWLSDQKRKLNCTMDEIYITLSKNIHVKKSLDEYLKNKESNKDFVKFTQDELKHLLFEYCNANKNAPSSKCEYKNAQIGGWLQNQKKTIKCNKDRAYINLFSNAYVKESLDAYLQCKSKNVANKIK